MAKINFVGFQENVEIPHGFSQVSFEEEIATQLDKDDLFSYFAIPSKISEWFYPCQSLDSRAGGKVRFLDSTGTEVIATCTAVNLGREISFLSNLFGQLNISVSKSGTTSKAHLQFLKLTDAPEETVESYKNFITRLEEVIAQ